MVSPTPVGPMTRAAGSVLSGNPGAVNRNRRGCRLGGSRYLEVEPRHGATVHDGAASRNCAVEHVGDEELCLLIAVEGGHVPGTVDERAVERIDRVAEAIEHNQA